MSSPLHQNHSDDRISQVVGNRWTLERVIGEGATSRVYAARDPSGAEAAVKLLRPEVLSDPEHCRRFTREGRLGAHLSHPGIVTVLDQDTNHPTLPYLAMELLRGETLWNRARRLGTIPNEELLTYVDQILDVLALAHSEGVVHRDLKPGNLWVTEEGRIKVLDFGIARWREPLTTSQATALGLALGTAPYMPPEQARGRHDQVDGRSDLFALGAILFRLLTGRRVHEGSTDGAVLAAMATKPAPPLRSVTDRVPAAVGQVVDLALGFAKESRYPDARTMQGDIRALLRREPPPYAMRRAAIGEQATMAPGCLEGLGTTLHQPVVTGELGRRATDELVVRTSAEPATDSRLGQLIADRYEVKALLGSGGMGSVYRAEHVHMRKAVALKVLHQELTHNQEIVRRFEREAVAAARIDHPHVATAKDFGRLQDGSFYLVLEYVEGRSLSSEIERTGPFPAQRATNIVRMIASALAAAHRSGIVHRDLKPDNVMLVERAGEADFVKVLDFGIAKLDPDGQGHQPALTRVGSVFGTPEYMSPEQAMGKPVDARSDLYALGTILYELLAGRTPFSDPSLVVVLTKQMTQTPPPLPNGVAPALVACVERLLSKDPSARFQSAEELEQHLAGLLASPPPAPGVRIAAAGSEPGLHPGFTALAWAAPLLRNHWVAPLLRSAWITRVLEHPSANAILHRQLRVLGRGFPVWQVLGASTVVAFLALATLVLRSGDEPGSPGPAPSVTMTGTRGIAVPGLSVRETSELPAPLNPSIQERITAAAQLAKNGETRSSVEAYRELLEREPRLAENPEVLGPLRRAANDPATREDVFELCVTNLGAHGADLLYDVWHDARRTATPASKAVAAEAEKRLSHPKVVAAGSPALRLAIDLAKPKACSGYKGLLPAAAEHGDGRAVAALRSLERQSRCRPGGGFKSLFKKSQSTCLQCLQGDPNLAAAIERAERTPGPTFE